jgi:hypothetical protein
LSSPKTRLPLAEGQVGRDDGGRALVPGGQDVEEQLPARLLEWNEAELVEQQERGAPESVLKTREDAGVACLEEGADQVRGAVEKDVVAALDGLDAQGSGQVSLAGADGADEHDVAGGVDPGASGEVFDARTLEAVGTSPVELREGLARWQSGGTEPALGRPLGAAGDFRVEQGAEKYERMLSTGERLACDLLALAPQGGKLEHAGVGAYGGQHDVDFVEGTHAEHLAASSSAS